MTFVQKQTALESYAAASASYLQKHMTAETLLIRFNPIYTTQKPLLNIHTDAGRKGFMDVWGERHKQRSIYMK